MQIYHVSNTVVCWQKDMRQSTNFVSRAPPCVPGDIVVGPS